MPHGEVVGQWCLDACCRLIFHSFALIILLQILRIPVKGRTSQVYRVYITRSWGCVSVLLLLHTRSQTWQGSHITPTRNTNHKNKQNSRR